MLSNDVGERSLPGNVTEVIRRVVSETRPLIEPAIVYYTKVLRGSHRIGKGLVGVRAKIH
jgi:hypothetical protein